MKYEDKRIIAAINKWFEEERYFDKFTNQDHFFLGAKSLAEHIVEMLKIPVEKDGK